MIEGALAMWKNFEETVFTIPQALYNNQMALGEDRRRCLMMPANGGIK